MKQSNCVSCFQIYFQIREQCQELILTPEKITELEKRFLYEINRGLSKETHSKADIKCFVTYVQDLPNGKGNFQSTANNKTIRCFETNQAANLKTDKIDLFHDLQEYEGSFISVKLDLLILLWC